MQNSSSVQGSIEIRTCVYRSTESGGRTVRVNVNDEIGLPPYCDYIIAEYLEDQQEYEGRKVVGVDGNRYFFSDATAEYLEEGLEQMSGAGVAMLPSSTRTGDRFLAQRPQ